jgi:NAD+ kinase
VVRGDANIRISIEGIPDQTFLTVDGQEAVQVRVGDEMHCRKSIHQLKLVRIGEVGFFNVLRQKLKWGER